MAIVSHKGHHSHGVLQPSDSSYEMISQYHPVVFRDLKLATLSLRIFGSKGMRAHEDTEMCEHVPGAAAWPQWFLCSLSLTVVGSATPGGAAEEG